MHLCKVCHSLTRTLEESKKGLLYYRCLSCGFVSLDDNYIIDKAKEKSKYDEHNNSLENLGYVQMFESFIDLGIEPYRNSVQSILEFGSGPEPVLAKLLEQRGFDVDIYDLFYAPKKVYEGKKYDLISSTEVFEHLMKPFETLEVLVQHTNTNGYLSLMTKFPPRDDEEFLAWWYRRDPTHISFFTPKSFEVMAAKLGLKVVKILNRNMVVFQKL